jgi:hypothetical protein
MKRIPLIAGAAMAGLIACVVFFDFKLSGPEEEITSSAPVSTESTPQAHQETSSSGRAAEPDPHPIAPEAAATAAANQPRQTPGGTGSTPAEPSVIEQNIRASLFYLPLYLPLSAEKTEQLVEILTEKATTSWGILSQSIDDPENRSGWREKMNAESSGGHYDLELDRLLSDEEMTQWRAFQQVQGGLMDIQDMNAYLPASSQVSNENIIRTLAPVLRAAREEYMASLLGRPGGMSFDPTALRNTISKAASPYLSPLQLDALAAIPLIEDTMTIRYR